jgi:hypothetical protein
MDLIDAFRDPARAQALFGRQCDRVTMRTNLGGQRLVDLLAGDHPPRICQRPTLETRLPPEDPLATEFISTGIAFTES